MIPIFTLSYSRLSSFSQQSNTKFINYIIDNNSQGWVKTSGCYYYATSRNIGCAGGWNLICDIAFTALDLDKIVITQDDLKIHPSLYEQIFEEATNNEIVGAIQPFYEFSAFAITKEVWKKVGRFDENCLYVYGEDVDYKHRCLLNDITISSLYEPNGVHGATIKDHPHLNRIEKNRAYISRKWGPSINPDPIAAGDGQPPFQYQTPFDDGVPTSYIHIGRDIVNLYGASNEFPSEEEYLRFLEYGFT